MTAALRLLQRQAARGLLLALLCTTGATLAQTSGDGTPWKRLSAPQRSALAPLERDWATLDASRQQKWLEIAARFPGMSADERERMQQRMAEWAKLSPRERGQARINFQEARQISPEERKARWESYQALPPDEKRRLADRARPPRNDRDTLLPGSATHTDGSKSNIVRAPSAPTPVRPVAPTVVQAGPGATTTLLSRPAKPPLHQQTGVPKIAATPAFVDSTTLLPKRGAQGAAARSAPASEPASEGP
ncbi:DUF3106 domain-containing protein [Aquincola tertiaricarbonis]|uniref:DUF3106 domain-containing protein n=1 Tax=Aquincola tertiaricarbonis TaxID=391953 RepID=UPI0006970629|nr:DUF3106 domain-containing protein [Aquincola tertiaricarbonis]